MMSHMMAGIERHGIEYGYLSALKIEKKILIDQ